MNRDCDFLEQERIMDYSMLVGLHFRGTSCNGNNTPSGDHSSGAQTPTGYNFSLMDFLNFVL